MRVRFRERTFPRSYVWRHLAISPIRTIEKKYSHHTREITPRYWKHIIYFGADPTIDFTNKSENGNPTNPPDMKIEERVDLPELSSVRRINILIHPLG